MSSNKGKMWTIEEGYMDGYLKGNLEFLAKAIHRDLDFVFVVDGPERSGKSVIAQQMAKFLDPTFCIERICFNKNEFVEQIQKAKKFQAVIFDEAFNSLASKDASNDVSKALISMMAEIGQKNLFVFIVQPSFHELNKYIAIWRSIALVHVYFGKNYERGNFAFYSFEKKKLLYIIGKKFLSYKQPRFDFHGKFFNGYSVDEEAYRQKKVAALNDYNTNKAKKEEEKPMEGINIVKWKDRMARLCIWLTERKGIMIQFIAAAMQIRKEDIGMLMKAYKIKQQEQAAIDAAALPPQQSPEDSPVVDIGDKQNNAAANPLYT